MRVVTHRIEATLARIDDADSVLRTQTSVVLWTLLERPFEFDAG
jgi:hypothetical protein